MNSQHYDLCIIGGGINGCGIAANAASRGLKVCLLEQGDLAQATSSWSSKLIHGGLRYLEHKEFRLVRDALKEREVLMHIAPHLIHELRFILPHEPHHRPTWMIRAGLFLYDNLAKRKKIKSSAQLNIDKSEFRPILLPHIKKGFIYSDCQTDDSRLVISNAMLAKEYGADILTHHACIQAKSIEQQWHIDIQNKMTQTKFTITATALINASGPWVNKVLEEELQLPKPYNMRLIKGSHIIVPKLYPQQTAFILQNDDGRIIFILPYQEEFSLIGTTDVDFKGDLHHPQIDQEEIDYLLSVVHQYFNTPLTQQDICAHYSGVRPLVDQAEGSAAAVSRDYIVHSQLIHGSPLVNIFSGKITTYRTLANKAVEQLKDFFPKLKPSLTHLLPLPGGDIPSSWDQFQTDTQKQYAWLPEKLLRRYLNQFGTLIHQLLANCQSLADLGQHFGHGLYQREIDYLIENEWAYQLEDIIWRRTKLGLVLSENEKQAVEKYLSKFP